ncbi:MAG: GAF domain-containing protein [Balneolaceae bacterium]|nr:GAF domain-containing protein [Balneolaceae bacterium]MCH8549651.1 GAF domain-containing protein [Balneolaceae bacterium]
MTTRREEKALLEFKSVIGDVVRLLRKSTEADTVYIYWVNKIREQFVLETSATILPNVMFRDRIPFDRYFLNDHKEIDRIIQLKVGEDLSQEDLEHYHDFVPVRYLTLVPFINNGETVAVTVIETEHQPNLSDYEEVLVSYRNALTNVLNTYLEVTDLQENQKEWSDYEEGLKRISPRLHKTDLLQVMMEELQGLLSDGGVSVVARGMESWVTVMRSETRHGLMSPPGLRVEEKSMAYDALQKGEPQFSIHFNQNPKRISPSENSTDGASMAIPLMINDRRHAVVLVTDKNPLVFKESSKHKMVNLVRLTSLAIQVNLGKVSVHEDIFANNLGSFIPDLWEKSLAGQIRAAGARNEKAWFGFVTIDNLTELRSSLRLEELNRVQRNMVKLINPTRNGFQGLVGFNTDYIYAFMLTGDRDELFKEWFNGLEGQFDKPIELLDGQKVDIRIKAGVVELDNPEADLHQVISNAKRALSEVLKSEAKTAINF